jgi:hypothetical protein
MMVVVTSLAGERFIAANSWQHFPASLGLKDREGKAMTAAPRMQPRNERPSLEVSGTCVHAVTLI